MRSFTKYMSLAAMLAIAVVMGCGESGGAKPKPPAAPPKEASKTAAPAASLPADLFSDAEPEGVMGVLEAKGTTHGVDGVVIRGRIGGRVEPFVSGAAVFLIVDTGLKSCKELHEDDPDACKTPWDYCCEPKGNLLANTATVQVVDEAGKPLRGEIRGQHGLEPLAEVIVAGAIVPQEDGGPLVINARKIFVVPAGG